MSRIMLAALLALIVAAPGCSSSSSKKEPDPVAQQRSRTPRDSFEAQPDPPLTADTRFAAGQFAETQGSYDNAVAQFREALKIDPAHRLSLYHLADIYTKSKHYDDAIPLWQRYVKASNNSAGSLNNLARCYELSDRLKEAEATYRTAVERDPKDAACRVNYGVLLARQNRIDEAAAQMSVVLPPAQVQYKLGLVYEGRGKLEEAKTCYRKALQLDPKLAEAQARLATLK
jgi:tetratricopeptide (TPR) repeat protein